MHLKRDVVLPSGSAGPSCPFYLAPSFCLATEYPWRLCQHFFVLAMGLTHLSPFLVAVVDTPTIRTDGTVSDQKLVSFSIRLPRRIASPRSHPPATGLSRRPFQPLGIRLSRCQLVVFLDSLSKGVSRKYIPPQHALIRNTSSFLAP